MRFNVILVHALLGLLLIPYSVFAEPPKEFYELPEVVAVQQRAYYLNQDLTLHLGLLPSDAFNKGTTIGLSYTHFFSDFLGWEIVDANYNFNSDTSLKNDIEALEVDIQSKGFEGRLDYMEYYITTSLIYTPLYNKSLLFNKEVVHGETSFVIGGGAAKFNDSGLNPLLTIGLYLRFFTRPDRSWKFDFRNNIYFEETFGAVNNWSIGVGYSMQLGDAPKREVE